LMDMVKRFNFAELVGNQKKCFYRPCECNQIRDVLQRQHPNPQLLLKLENGVNHICSSWKETGRRPNGVWSPEEASNLRVEDVKPSQESPVHKRIDAKIASVFRRLEEAIQKSPILQAIKNGVNKVIRGVKQFMERSMRFLGSLSGKVKTLAKKAKEAMTRLANKPIEFISKLFGRVSKSLREKFDHQDFDYTPLTTSQKSSVQKRPSRRIKTKSRSNKHQLPRKSPRSRRDHKRGQKPKKSSKQGKSRPNSKKGRQSNRHTKAKKGKKGQHKKKSSHHSRGKGHIRKPKSNQHEKKRPRREKKSPPRKNKRNRGRRPVKRPVKRPTRRPTKRGVQNRPPTRRPKPKYRRGKSRSRGGRTLEVVQTLSIGQVNPDIMSEANQLSSSVLNSLINHFGPLEGSFIPRFSQFLGGGASGRQYASAFVAAAQGRNTIFPHLSGTQMRNLLKLVGKDIDSNSFNQLSRIPMQQCLLKMDGQINEVNSMLSSIDSFEKSAPVGNARLDTVQQIQTAVGNLKQQIGAGLAKRNSCCQSGSKCCGSDLYHSDGKTYRHHVIKLARRTRRLLRRMEWRREESRMHRRSRRVLRRVFDRLKQMQTAL
jgi:hypothetical protein